MEVFVGRQPILNRRKKTVAYELLFRSGMSNRFDGTEGNLATATVISNTFITMGADRALGSRMGFLNFPREFLLEGNGFLLPRDRVVIEILEDVEGDGPVVEAARKLKESGYRLALDDVSRADQAAPLLPFVEYVKLDFRAMEGEERRRVAAHFRSKGVRLVAEKVETEEDYAEAAEDGFELFQGYFFARPEIISAREVPASKGNCLRLLSEIHQPELDFDGLAKLISQDLALARKLLCFVNSAAFPFRKRIESIFRALVALGENSIRKWASMAALPSLASAGADELVNTSLVRARFCELAAEESKARLHAGSCFLVGLFSLLDAMIGRPLEELMEEMALDPVLAAAILRKPGEPTGRSAVLELAMAFESADPVRIRERAAVTGIDMVAASELYVRAIEWAEALNRARR